MGKCRFKNDWLLKKDNNDFQVSSWGKRYSEHELFCNVCSCVINVENKGFHSVLQHSDTTKHKKLCRGVLNPSQLQLAASPQNLNIAAPTSINLAPPTALGLFSIKDNATIAELIWTMKTVCSNFSFASCQNIAEVFTAMFPGALSKHFSLSPKKMNYLLTDALQPYFHKLMLKDMDSTYYTICFDETTNVEDKKELQITIRYWSDSRNEVVCKHLNTCFIGKADADTLKEKILSVIQANTLSLEKLLMIGSDGPNVNKKVFRLINEEILSVRSKGLIDIGTCAIHTVHNSFLKGMQAVGNDAVELVISLYNYFDGWPSRIEDFEKIQKELKLPSHKFLKHSSTRWLTFGIAARRLIEQWEGINQYFFKHIPATKKSQMMHTISYKKISSLLKKPSMKAELYFAISSADVFMKFTKKFQQDEPLIHVMYSELEKLVQTLSNRICKAEVSRSMKIYLNEDLNVLFGGNNFLPLNSITLPAEVISELAKISSNDKLLFLKSVREHYSIACKYIIQKANFSDLMKALRCLQPDERIKVRSCRDIITVARSLPFDVAEDDLIDEWKLLQAENEEAETQNFRIEKYWAQFFTKLDAFGTVKFKTVSKVVKSAFTLSHGNADIERRFSVSRWTLTEDRASTSERTLNAILTTKDALRQFDNSPHLVPITKELVNLARSAHASYQIYMEKIKKAKEDEQRKLEEDESLKKELNERQKKVELAKKKIQEIELDLEKKSKDHENSKETTNQLFEEATKRLTKALQNNDLKEAKLANAMLEGVSKLKETEQEKCKVVQSLQKRIEKRKSNVISSFFSKKQKLLE